MSDAVALMAKTPLAGAVKTRLVPPLTPDQAAAVARLCLETTLRRFLEAAPAMWTLFLDGPREPWLATLCSARGVAIREQGDGDLGARLARAFRALHENGARRVVAIGSDSPTLDPAWIARALDALDHSDAVIGPARDGGYYLVGLRSGCESLLEEIPWSTPAVCDATRGRATAAGLRLHELPEWYDVDDAATLAQAVQDAGSGSAFARGVATIVTSEEPRKTGKGAAG